MGIWVARRLSKGSIQVRKNMDTHRYQRVAYSTGQGFLDSDFGARAAVYQLGQM